MGVLIATADGAMAQRHRIAILTARNVYNFDNVSNNLFLSGNTLRGQFRLPPSPPSTPSEPSHHLSYVPWLIAKFVPTDEITHTSDMHPYNRVIMSIIRPEGRGRKKGAVAA